MAEIGENATIYQGVTIGAANNGAPKIGCGVMIGANATVIGAIEVGDYVRVGGGTTVVKDVPSYATVVSQSARIIMRDEKV
jgi:serine O-acetyltransferase